MRSGSISVIGRTIFSKENRRVMNIMSGFFTISIKSM